MPLHASCFKKTFEFNFKARTSRGLMRDRTSWFIRIRDENNPAVTGWGECGPLPGLSPDHRPDYEAILETVIADFNSEKIRDLKSTEAVRFIPPGYPSIRFGFETALADLAHDGRKIIFNNDFTRGKRIPINGLIWMGDMDFMMGQVNIKIGDGFRCVKLKVGGLDFETECDVLQYIRKRYYREDVTLRLDANGAFKVDDAMYKLEQLARFNIHSIEQPLKPGLSGMEEVCRKSPIPVALDEELIGKETVDEKKELLSRLRPSFIVLKPMFHGFGGCRDWISVADSLGIGWWMTSSLESSIGLNAICQFTAGYDPALPQGLGTGGIYDNNFASPLEVQRGEIFYNERLPWDEELTGQRPEENGEQPVIRN